MARSQQPRRMHPLGLLWHWYDPLSYLLHLQRRAEGGMATLTVGKGQILWLFRPEDIHTVLQDTTGLYRTREMTGGLHELIGDGLLTLDGEMHRRERRLMQPVFTKARVEGYAPFMVCSTQELLSGLHPGMHVDLARIFHQLFLRIIAACLLGVDLGSQVASMEQALSTMVLSPPGLLEHLGLRMAWPTTALGRRLAARSRLDAWIDHLLEERQQGKGEEDDGLLAWLLRTEGETREQVRAHIRTILLAGQETGANGLTWACYLLSEHPAARARLQEELGAVLDGRAPTTRDLAHLPYLDAVVNETLRLYPPAWISGRYAAREFSLGGYTFPAGTRVIVSPWAVHRHPDYWSDQEAFRPERWLPDTRERLFPWAFFPFGGGPRTCIGMSFAQMELRLVLACLMQRFAPRLLPGHRVQIQPLLSLRPRGGMPMLMGPVPTASANSR